MEPKYEKRTSDFYCCDARKSQSPLQCFAHLHYHIEMGIVFEGKTKVYIDSKEYDMEGGDLFICFPNQIHQYETIKQEKHILFIFNPDILPEFSKHFITLIPNSSVIKNISADSEIISLMEKISEVYHDNTPYKNTIIRGYLLALFGKIFSIAELTDIKNRDIKTLGMILNYCEKNYDQPLTLSAVERALHISKFHISHTLNTKLRIGFNDYINSLRVSNACKYLLTTDMSVTEISERVGFNTPRTFNRAFSKYMGTTPTGYRHKKTDPNLTSLPI